MRIRTLAACAVALTLPFAAVACGDDSTGDLSEEEISDALQEGGLDAETSDCIAGDLKDADLTEDELNEFTESQDVDSRAGEVLMEAMSSCLGTDIDLGG
jgi:hypothetical protein